MARKYKFWDKKEPITTLGKDPATGKMVWEASEYISSHAPWAANSSVKVLVATGAINGLLFMEWERTKQLYESMGMVIPEGLTDEQALQVMEDFEEMNNMPDTTPTAEERIAAAMEYQNLLTLPDVDTAE